MKITTKLTNRGLTISLREDDPKTLEADPVADQDHPKRHYVYAHLDKQGRIFYVGKGAGKRAWSTDRHPLWHRYVNNHLKGEYTIQILQDNLALEESEKLEDAWIAQCSDTVVNWVNMGPSTDYKALDEYHKLRDANRTLIESAKSLELTDLEAAVKVYNRAIEALRQYATMSYEGGIVGQLLAEESAEMGINGELQALDRLSLCLIRLGRAEEAARQADSYFALYKRDLRFAGAARIMKRVEKALGKAGLTNHRRRPS